MVPAEAPAVMGVLHLGEAMGVLRVPSPAARAECDGGGGALAGLRGEAEEEERGGIGRAKGGLRRWWSSICTCIAILLGM